jgi:L-lactate dehydrogenase complex protein LldG
MATREEMLNRVRTALGRPEAASSAPDLPALELAGVMPPIDPGEYLEKFELELQKVSGVSHRVSSLDELDSVLRSILADTGDLGVVLSGNPILKKLGIAGRIEALGKSVTAWEAVGPDEAASSLDHFKTASFAAGAGITGVDFALAESGTLVLTSATEGAQVSSLAPPLHIALFRREQLAASLDEVLAKLPISTAAASASPNRSVVFITGTSRTADIEQILIRGVHGPREVHAIFVDEGCQ